VCGVRWGVCAIVLLAHVLTQAPLFLLQGDGIDLHYKGKRRVGEISGSGVWERWVCEEDGRG
jgi:hypothetical protein